ncbi:MAG TPA: glutathione S-transferase N-terminal domain-containing protein [Burkholderiales bacterium]|nr:glutathione S-transferase N-terminal domain-containing protein [Burkholderiales bacterium]
MKLYCTPGSPYARMARIVVIEKGLEKRVEIVMAQTRKEGSPYYAINPSGRVPYLVRDDGVGMEESQLICAFLGFEPSADWEARRLEGLARSLMDGLAVWLRELYRPQNERSPGLIRHEAARAARLLDAWEREIAHPHLRGALNMVQLTLACALGIEMRMPDLDWRSGHPKLVAWYEPIAARPSFVATRPPQ